MEDGEEEGEGGEGEGGHIFVHVVLTLMYHTALKIGTSFSQKFSKISSFLLKTGTYIYNITNKHYTHIPSTHCLHLYIHAA